ncbi:4986_t:CDS:2 [Funneliformis geosporum]|nr:4986_t:CDS:2 [Funneliformis geosporum]
MSNENYIDVNSNNEKNILIFGRTGSGKSTLGSVLVNKNGDIKYIVIDTIGIGDTKKNEKEVLYKLGEAAHKIRDGLNQLFFVSSGRFNEEEIYTYNLLKDFIFDEDVVKHTTIVRTKFENFNDKDECYEDQERMIKENIQLENVIRFCNKVIHVNNPQMNIKDKGRLDMYKKDSEDSRSKLLMHLGSCNNTLYKPKKLDSLNARIGVIACLPGFVLDVHMIEEAISQVCCIFYWDLFLDLITYIVHTSSSSSGDEDRFKCTETLLINTHFQKEHALKQCNQHINQ